MKPFEIFRPGTFRANSGQEVKFSEAALAQAASAYDPALHEAPLCVGHPVDDAPAYGWVRGLTYDKSRLLADPAQVEPAFAELVVGGRYKKRSAAFYSPAHPQNPKPGTFYLKHVAFLGAVPPAVKGLKEVSFSDDADTVTFEFAEEEFSERDDYWGISSLVRGFANIARGFREFLIAEKGQEEADRIAANWQIDDMVAQSERFADKARDLPSNFSEDPEDNVKTQAEIDAAKADLEKREAEIKAREDAVKAQEASFSESEKKSRREANARELDELVKAGKFAPGLKAEALDFMDGLDSVTVVEFGEGDAKAKKTPSAWFLDLLKKSGTVIDFSERAAGKDAIEGAADVVSFSAPSDATVDAEGLKLHNKALAYQAEHPNIDYMAAVRAVGGR